MCDRRKLLLAAIVVYYEVTLGSALQMDMAVNSVDYMYNGCQKEAMKKLIHSDLLKQELNNNKDFHQAWDANPPCPNLIPGVTKEHMAALLAYTDGARDFRKTFDNAVANLGGNLSIFEKSFHFKSLHFLLMDAMLLMSTKKYKTLYLIREKEYRAEIGTKVRFGKFTKVQTSYSVLKATEDFERHVIFNITSCFYINLGSNICSQDQEMALLSPAEVFTVEAVREMNVDDTVYTEIALNHAQLAYSHNCYSMSGSPADVSTQWLVLMLVAFALMSFNY